MTTEKLTLSERINCPSCGYSNAGWRTDCEQCKEPLRSSNTINWPRAERPGCLTAYIVLGAIGALGIGGFGLLLLSERETGLAFFLLAIAVIDTVVLRGLWQLKNWARLAIIVLRSLNILLALLLLLNGNPFVLVGIGVSVYLIYWFASNGDYFS